MSPDLFYSLKAHKFSTLHTMVGLFLGTSIIVCETREFGISVVATNEEVS